MLIMNWRSSRFKKKKENRREAREKDDQRRYFCVVCRGVHTKTKRKNSFSSLFFTFFVLQF